MACRGGEVVHRALRRSPHLSRRSDPSL
jgi:hypothetical protein